jgi:hypothetical protein
VRVARTLLSLRGPSLRNSHIDNRE